MPYDPASAFRPVERIDGYLPLEDHGLICDGTTAAVVARDGAIVWSCLPRFDSPAVLCSLLDRDAGGHFTVSPGGLEVSRQRYVEDTGVLVTERQVVDGTVELTDALTLQGARAVEVGLLPEQIDPSTGRFLGNLPQAFSHVGVIASGVAIARARQEAST